jgi:uncharacterized protein YPO0396
MAYLEADEVFDRVLDRLIEAKCELAVAAATTTTARTEARDLHKVLQAEQARAKALQERWDRALPFFKKLHDAATDVAFNGARDASIANLKAALVDTGKIDGIDDIPF